MPQEAPHLAHAESSIDRNVASPVPTSTSRINGDDGEDGVQVTDRSISNGAPVSSKHETNGSDSSGNAHYAHLSSSRAHADYLRQISVPLRDETAFTPTKRLRVAVIGAGYAGITLAQKLQHKYREEMEAIVDFTIFETKDQVGGTWVANTYPGVMCDVPSAIYALPFDPNPEWSHFYSSGLEIRTYIQERVRKHNLDKHIEFRTTVCSAIWQEDSAQWKLGLSKDDGASQREELFDVLISARGFLTTPKWPDIPGLHDFTGKLVHSAAWDHGFDYAGKRIGVIGNGSSGIQIIPQMAALPGTHVTSFQRGPTWIVSRMTPATLLGSDDPSFNPAYREEDKALFRDPAEMKKYRKKVQSAINSSFKMFRKGSEENRDAEEFARKQMAEKLKHDPLLCEKLIPKYILGCRRITPGQGYLEAFTQPNVQLTNSPITRITADGMLTSDGAAHALDVIVCSTGFDVSQVPAFPLVGRGGVALADKWRREPESYMSLACPDMPNYFIFTGPNATVGHGSLLESMQWSAEWMLQWLRKMAAEDIASVAPRQDVVDEFVRYGDEIHRTLAWTGGCRSWYKANRVDGRVTATFAGSAILYHQMVKQIRPEDFEIRYRSRNRFRFMGNGFTAYELDPANDLSYYVTN